MPISGGSALEFETRNGNTTSARCGTFVWREESKKQDGLTSQSPSQRKM
jgi:hypothetical protein